MNISNNNTLFRNAHGIASTTGVGFLFVFKACQHAHSRLRNCWHNAEDGQKDKQVVEVISRTFLSCFLILFFGIGNSIAEMTGESQKTPLVETSNAAKEVVVEFQNVLIDVMKQGENLSFKARCDQLEGAILKSHDVIKSLRTIVGSKQWKSFSEEQRSKLSNVFTKFIVSTYASNFNEFSNESFIYVSEHTTKKGNVIIRSILEIPQGKRKKVTFDYALKNTADNWKIYNIAADGVSDLATRRSEYRRILANDNGFESLIAIISEKIDNYAK